MGAPQFSDDDLTQALSALLPRGRVWPTSPDTIIGAVMRGVAPTWRRLCDRVSDLVSEAFPSTAVQLLPEWEASLGLPDPCAGPAPTVPQRQAQVVARFAKTGGQSVQFYIDLALALGYVITITEFSVARFGMRFGSRFGGPDWAYVWQVNAQLYNDQAFRFGHNRFGDRFSIFGNAVLECELNAVKPAHTLLLFSYT